MPTVMRIHGWRVVIYPNDHSPPHVHVLGPGWAVVVDLDGPTVREALRCDERQARSVLSQVAPNRDLLLAAWRRWHG